MVHKIDISSASIDWEVMQGAGGVDEAADFYALLWSAGVTDVVGAEAGLYQALDDAGLSSEPAVIDSVTAQESSGDVDYEIVVTSPDVAGSGESDVWGAGSDVEYRVTVKQS